MCRKKKNAQVIIAKEQQEEQQFMSITGNYGDTSSPCSTNNSVSAELMILIGQAIDDWAKQYHLENLPKDMIFEQALAAMNALHRIYTE